MTASGRTSPELRFGPDHIGNELAPRSCFVAEPELKSDAFSFHKRSPTCRIILGDASRKELSSSGLSQSLKIG
jgi:hypothetical protein